MPRHPPPPTPPHHAQGRVEGGENSIAYVQFTGLKLSVENSDCMICSFWFENRTPGPKLIGAMMPDWTFLVFSSSPIVQAQVGSLPHRPIASISTLAAA